jgi:hypothetical protein
MTSNTHGAAAGRDNPGEAPQRGGFAGAVRTDEAQHFTRPEGKRKLTYGGEFAVKFGKAIASYHKTVIKPLYNGTGMSWLDATAPNTTDKQFVHSFRKYDQRKRNRLTLNDLTSQALFISTFFVRRQFTSPETD